MPLHITGGLIDMVAETQVSGTLVPVYNDIRRTLGVSLVNDLFKTLAVFPDYLQRAWRVVRPNVVTGNFDRAALRIRDEAHSITAEHAEDHTSELSAIGWNLEEIDLIQSVMDIFDYLNSCALLICTVWDVLLPEDHEGGKTKRKDRLMQLPAYPFPIATIAPNQATGKVEQIFDDIMATLHLPLVSSDYQAIALSPDYLAISWEYLKRLIDHPDYPDWCSSVLSIAVEEVHSLPVAMSLSSTVLSEAGMEESQISDIIDTLDLFRGLLPGLVLNISALVESLS